MGLRTDGLWNPTFANQCDFVSGIQKLYSHFSSREAHGKRTHGKRTHDKRTHGKRTHGKRTHVVDNEMMAASAADTGTPVAVVAVRESVVAAVRRASAAAR